MQQWTQFKNERDFVSINNWTNWSDDLCTGSKFNKMHNQWSLARCERIELADLGLRCSNWYLTSLNPSSIFMKFMSLHDRNFSLSRSTRFVVSKCSFLLYTNWQFQFQLMRRFAIKTLSIRMLSSSMSLNRNFLSIRFEEIKMKIALKLLENM